MRIVLLLFILVNVLFSAFGLRCYQCDSLTNSACGIEFHPDDTLKFDCDRLAPPRFLQNILPVRMRNATGCMKKTLESVAGRPQIVRTCYFGDIANTRVGCQSDPSLPFVKDLSCDVCSADLCNGSTLFGPVLFVILIAATSLSLIL